MNSSDDEGVRLTYITTSNVYWGYFELSDLKTMPFTESEIEKCTVQKGDLLVCEGGDFGRASIWEFDDAIRIQNHIHRLRPYGDIDVKLYYYLFYLYKSNGMIEGNGIGLQGLSSNKLHAILVPLPPYHEQVRIVKSISQIFNILDNMEASFI